MPRYFFHTGDELDRVGLELPDDAAAHAMACDTVGQMVRDKNSCDRLRMDVATADGRKVLLLTFEAFDLTDAAPSAR